MMLKKFPFLLFSLLVLYIIIAYQFGVRGVYGDPLTWSITMVLLFVGILHVHDRHTQEGCLWISAFLLCHMWNTFGERILRTLS